MTDDLDDIPAFLLLTREQRAAAWERNPPKPVPVVTTAPREVERLRAEAKAAKTQARIAKLKAGLSAQAQTPTATERRGMRWNAMKARWMKDV